MYTFGILALLSETVQKQRKGGLESVDLRILEYFAAEAKEERRKNSHLFDSKKERLGSALFREMVGNRGDRPSRHGEPVLD